MSELREELKDRDVEDDNMPGRLRLEVTAKGFELSVLTLRGKELKHKLIGRDAICKGEYMVNSDVDFWRAHMGIESALEDVIYHAGKLSREFWEASDE